jgi:hypothetical protein
MMKDKQTREMAIMATKHCLIGCGIGEVLGMVIGTALGWDNLPTMALAISLAFLFGYSFTYFPLTKKMSKKQAAKTAFIADTASITSMEIIDNGFILLIPGAIHAGLGDFLFWWTLGASLIIAFLVTVPVNYWMIARGKGHAIVHDHHNHHSHEHHH